MHYLKPPPRSIVQLHPLLMKTYCLVPVKVKFAFKFNTPVPIVEIFAGITPLAVQTQLCEQSITQFPEAGILQVLAL